MTRKAIADMLSGSRLLLAGIRAHSDEFEKVSFPMEELEATEKALAELSNLDVQQEKAKADLKSLTGRVMKARKSVDERMANLKRYVKFVIPQNQWLEFGISDKK